MTAWDVGCGLLCLLVIVLVLFLYRTNRERRRQLRKAGLIVGLLGVGLYTILLLAVALFGAGDILGIFGVVILPGLFLYGSFAVALKWERTGWLLLGLEGLVTIVVSVVYIVGMLVYSGRINNHSWALLIAGLLLLVSGILFRLAWGEGQRTS